MRSPTSMNHVLARVCTPVLALALLSVQSTPALAADPTEVVQLSADGVSYSRSIKALYGPSSLSPMSSVHEKFWVKNAGESSAYLTIQVADVGVADPDLAGALTLSAFPSGSPGPGFALPAADACLTINAGSKLAKHESVRIDSDLALGDLMGQLGQGVNVHFALRVILSDQPLAKVGDTECFTSTGGDGGDGGGSGGGSNGGGSGGGGDAGKLPVTGAQFTQLGIVAAVLAVAGAAIAALTRRRR